ncbi:MAG: fimbrillin family protein [Alistipes sp.]|nr:fimbrillin family protein [Alistipes sp.]
MKKIFIAMLALAAASCAKNEVVELNREAIGFGDVFVENATRATDPSYSGTADFTSFQVWGTVNGGAGLVAIYADDSVSGAVGANSVWTCTSQKQYWVKDAEYYFAALANADNVALGDDKLPKTVTYTADQTDLVYAKSAKYVGLESDNPLVAFTFNHLLSLVNFTVENGSQEAEGYSFEVNGITIAGTTGGTCDVTASPVAWTQTTAGNYSIDAITVDNSTASKDCGTALLVIPGTVSVSFNVDILCDGTKIATKAYSKADITLAAGNSYNFVVTPKVGEEIKFNVENDPTWTSADDTTIQ